MKPGQHTTEFLLTVCLVVGTTAAAIANAVPHRYAVYVGAISVAAYAISRGLAKMNGPNPPPPAA